MYLFIAGAKPRWANLDKKMYTGSSYASARSSISVMLRRFLFHYMRRRDAAQHSSTSMMGISAVFVATLTPFHIRDIYS